MDTTNRRDDNACAQCGFAGETEGFPKSVPADLPPSLCSHCGLQDDRTYDVIQAPGPGYLYWAQIAIVTGVQARKMIANSSDPRCLRFDRARGGR